MVFESVFANLLNKYLSDFIDDVSASQLKLGALKGNIALRNLAVKPNAFDALRLPFHVIHGHVGSLVMKIPWMSLYTNPVIVELKDIFVVCVPDVESSYDEEYEEQLIQAEKQKQLQNIDEAIKKAALSSVSSENTDEPKNDDFVTKTVAQIVKNLEITIKNVHIVYEDKFTCPKVPFSAGITLSKLLFKTEPSLQKTAKFTPSKPDNCIFKQVKLEYLSAYWNCAPSEFISEANADIRDDLLLDSIPSHDKMVTHLNYILEPNMFCASSIINRKPEIDKFSMPLLDLDMVLDQLSFCFNRAQFESFLLFLDAINRIKVANVFRKWRPKQSIHENRKAWWKFAITAILETEIRRKNKEWSWSNIKQHRKRIQRYKELYESKLRKVNFTKENESELESLEKEMDLLSIVVSRNEAEKVVSEERKKQAALKSPAKEEPKGWFSNWWWGGGKESTEQKEKTIVDQFKSEMTSEEKLKFYNAIGYEESTGPTEFPPEFVAHLVNLNLKTFKFIVVDVDKGERILQFTLDGLKTEVHNRPASNGLLLKASIYAMHIYGCRGAVLADEQLKDDSLLKLTVELNPLSKKFDYGLDLNVKTMKFVFDALTVNTLLEIVSPPEDVSFDELQSMASMKISEFREMSATGLEYAIEQHKQLNANINVEPSFIVVPENGNIRDCTNVLLISLGKVNLVSNLIDKEEVKNIRKMTKSDSGSIIEQYREKAYEKYALSVAQIQVLLSNVNRWKEDIVKSQLDATADFTLSDRRLIEPISINLMLMRAIVSDDPEMPNMKVSCDIPSLYVKATDIQINDLISLATSIPTTTPKSESLDIPRIESTSIIRAKQANDAFKVVEMKSEAQKKISDTQLTELHLTFSVGSMVIDLRTQEGSINKDVLKIKALSFGAIVEKKTFNLKAAFQLKEIKIEAFDEVHKSGNPFMFLETSQKSNLLVIKYEFCARNSPLFKDTIQEVDIKISEIVCSVSRPVLTSVLVWSQNIVNRLPKSEPPPERTREHRPSFSLRTRASSFASLTGVGLKQKKVKPQSKEAELEVSNFAAFFEIECFYFHIESICSVAFKGFNCDLKLSASEKIFFDASWQHFAVVNKISNAVMYEYIIQSESEKVLEMGVIMYPKQDVEQMKSSVDILVKVNFGRLKVVFLNRFVSELLSFLSVFEAAKAKAIDAGSAAAVYAKQSAVNAIESATKIGLHLILEAPNIIVPRNWDSKQYVLLDLGKVVITNDIKSSSKLVLDTINCELTSTRIAVITDDSMQSLDNILAPISFSVKITRNLSFETNKTQPELNLSATLHDIQLNIAQCDLKLAMQILTENIAAGASVQTLQEPVRALENVTQRKTSNIAAAITASNLHSSVIVEEAVVHVDADHETLLEPIYVRFNFDFLLPRITLNLFDGNSKVDNARLCELLLNELECYGVVRTNDTVHAGMSVSSVEVSDVRKGRTDAGIRKIVSTKQSTIPETDKTAKMLAISYTQQTDAFIDINMSGFTIILALDYLLHVTNVITAGLATQSEQSESVNKTQATAAPTEISQNNEPEETTPTKQVGLMVVDCKMSRTDIVLIECIDRTDSPAVILNAFVEVGLKQQEERIHFTGKIANIQLGITNFEKYMKNNDDIEAYILKPTELNVVAAINGTTQHFDVMFNEIVLHISPNTVQLLLSILSSLGKTETKTKDDQASIKDEQIDIKTFFAARKITEIDKYWFLKSHVCTAIEATEESFSTPSTPTPTNHSPFLVVQQVVLTLNKLSVVVESGGIDSQPMVKFDTSVSGNFDNWNKLNLTFTCFMDYYNEKLFVWEPVIEPVEKCSLWNFDLMLDIVNNGDSTATYNASIESKDRLELTLSKAALGVLTTCGDAFANAVKQSESLAHENLIVITNELGIDLYIFVSVAKFKCVSPELQPKIENDMICLRIPSTKVGKFQATSTDPQSLESESDINFKLIVGNNQIERSISLKAKDKRCYNFPIVSYPGKEWKYVIDMSQRDSHTKNIVFHSTVEITNKFRESLELYYTEEGDIKMFAEIKSKQQILLPLRLVYSPSQEVFVKPSSDYCTPLTSISWKARNSPDEYVNIRCESKKGLPDYHIRLKQTVEDLLFEESQLVHNDSCCFKFELLPTFKLRNLLPVPVKYSFEGVDKQWSLGPGNEHDITHVDLKNTSMKIKIENYLNKNWSASQLLPSKWTTEDKIDVWTYTVEPNNSATTMELAMNYSTSDISGIRVASIFSPFWMINKTDLTVMYKVGDSIIKHETNLTVPVMVCFRPKFLFSKKKLSLAFDDSKWSDEFSIDAVGNKGTVVAKGKGKSKMSFCASIDIALSSFNLTKIVSVSPFYLMQNKTHFDLQISEDNDEWVLVHSKKSKGFWPKNAKDNKLYFRLTNDVVSSHPISLEDTNSSLLPVGDQLINVHVEVSDSGVTVSANNYFKGSATVRIFNATTDLSIDYGQQCISRRNRIPPMSCAYFTWHEPMLRRVLVWSSPECGEMFLELDKDAVGEAASNLFWVTFLDAKQRILLITRDFEMAKNALHAGELAKPLYNAVVSLRGIGISLVNNDKNQEIMYIGIYSSGVVWEVAKHKTKKYKALSVKQNETIEAAFQKEVLRRRVTNDLVISDTADRPTIVSLTNSLKVDLSDLNNPTMIEPIRGMLRRSSSLGFWCSVGISEHVFQFHLKINRIQIDNQADDCFFGIIMCPVTPPKSLAQDRAPKAFIEISSLIQTQAHLQRFKFLSVLIQEFLIQVDGDFLMSLNDFFASSKRKKEKSYEKMIQDDLKEAFENEITVTDIAQSFKNYYDLIHFSPIKVHVSFALGNAASWELLGMLDFLIKSAGVTLTEFKDVLFKIDFFEKKNVLLSQEELTSLAVGHYTRQVLKQFYVIVLGLDVIGNPVGLFLGLKQGVGDFFYEPVVGIIEGPEEFAEGLAIGVKSLFSHTVGGAAGALGRITGTLSQGLSSLTMDEEDKRRRRETLNRKHTFSQSGKNLAKGFLSGVTGLVTKPLQGAKAQGIEGLFKGVGRGVVGVVAQPATGVIDFASGSLNAIQRAVDVNAEAKKQRPARHIQKDGVIRPYNRHEAEGRSLLRELNKGEYADTDVYIAHSAVVDGTLLISDKNVFYLKQSCLFKNIDIDWCEPYENIANIEIINNTDIKISLREQKKRLGGLMSGEFERIAACQSADIAAVSPLKTLSEN